MVDAGRHEKNVVGLEHPRLGTHAHLCLALDDEIELVRRRVLLTRFLLSGLQTNKVAD